MRTCVICGVGIAGKPVLWRTCSPQCSAVLRKEDNRRRLAEYRAGRVRERRAFGDPRFCLSCGVSIDDLHPNAKTCSPRCYDDLDNERARAQRQQRHMGRECAICRTSLDGTPYQTKTCSDECRREYGRAYRRNRHARFGREYTEQQRDSRKQYMREYARRNAEALKAKKAAYREANRERLRQAEKDRLQRDGHSIRARARDRYAKRLAALKLIREIETKGLEALL